MHPHWSSATHRILISLLAPHSPQVPAASLRDHARYRYLLNLDGSSASFRLAQLLVVNSLVLKQTSPYIEYYYRWAQATAQSQCCSCSSSPIGGSDCMRVDRGHLTVMLYWHARPCQLAR